MTWHYFPRKYSRAATRIHKTTVRAGNVLGCFAGVLLCFGSPAFAGSLPNGRDLVARSLVAGERNLQPIRSYVSRTRWDSKQFEPDGALKSEEIKTYDDALIDGFHVRKLIEKNDKPLNATDQAKEDSRISKLIAQRKRESPEQRSRQDIEAKLKQDKEQRFAREVVDAFDFQVTGQELVNGRKSWVLEATPHPGYKPKEFRAQVFLHLRGRIWIDQQDLLWAKADAFAFEPFAVGFSVIAKLEQGARLFFEQSRLDDGTWVVTKFGLKANARLGMVKRIAIERLVTSKNYRKVPLETVVPESKSDF